MPNIFFTPNGENRTPEIVNAIRTAADGTTVFFAPGVYDFYREGSHEDYFSPSCNTSSDKWVIFLIIGKKNLTIDGNGATFLFHDRVFPFISQHTEGLTLRNFTIDFSFPLYLDAVTEEVTDDFIRIRILDTDVSCHTNNMKNLCVPVGDEIFETCERRFFLQELGGPNCYLVAGKYFYENKNLPTTVFYCDAYKDDGTIVFRKNGNTSAYPNFMVGRRLAVSYDENRMNDVMFLDRSKDILVENVKIHRGAGMGIVGNCCENLTADNFTIEVAPERDESFSTTADGMLLTNFTGLIHVKNCKIHNTMDDAMSIHGFYTRVERITAPDKLTTRLVHLQQSGIKPYSRGDTVTFSCGETLKETVTATVKDACMGRDTDIISLTFTEPIFENVKAGDWIENKTKMPEVIIENSDFCSFPALRIGNPKKTVFRNNKVKNGAFIINDLLSYWAASGCVHNLKIENNTFENSGIIFDYRRGSAIVKHSDITIKNNIFINCPTSMLASHAERISFTDNTLENSGNAFFDETCSDITLERRKKQLLMRWNPKETNSIPIPDGYKFVNFRRGGIDGMSVEKFKYGYLKTMAQGREPEDWEFSWFYDDKRIPDDGFFVIVSEEIDRIVATAAVQIDEHKPNSATLHMVYSDPEHRGKKLGEAVTLVAMQYVYSHNIPVMYLTTDEHRIPAIKIYLRHGFRPVYWDTDMEARWSGVFEKLGISEATIYDENENEGLWSAK